MFDHFYHGLTRKELIHAIKRWETQDQPGPKKKVQKMKAAIEFFDEIGWQTPLALKGEAPDDYLAPESWFQVSDHEVRDDEEI